MPTAWIAGVLSIVVALSGTLRLSDVPEGGAKKARAAAYDTHSGGVLAHRSAGGGRLTLTPGPRHDPCHLVMLWAPEQTLVRSWQTTHVGTFSPPLTLHSLHVELQV